jgi:ppGpp synthetase/RelA/SpoT-type nucleotidyltranferase
MVRRGPNQIAAGFLAWYTQNQADNIAAARALEAHVEQLLADNNCRPLIVSARAKTIDSVRAKLLRKTYREPRALLTDRLGVRVILYHAREVDDVAALLRTKMQVREADSSDKRLALGLREFGYRSYHLVGSLPKTVTAAPSLWSLRGQTFEAQIRSLLEHVWAEIEHDVVYKSGANWPPEIKRRFASIAGVLELLEHEFDQLTVTASHLVDEAVESLRRQSDAHRALDVPCMCALLEIEHSAGLSFRAARAVGKPFPPGIEQLMQLALERAGICTVGALQRCLKSKRVRSSVRRYAISEGITRDEVSHLALLALVVAVRSPAAFRVFFPEFAAEVSMRMAVKARH